MNATTGRTVYRRPTGSGPAVVALLSVPGVQPFNNSNYTVNPASGVADLELASLAQSTYRSFDDGSAAASVDLQVFENGTTASVVETTGTRGNERVPVTVLVTTVRRDDTYLTVVAVVPADAWPDERSRIQRLLQV